MGQRERAGKNRPPRAGGFRGVTRNNLHFTEVFEFWSRNIEGKCYGLESGFQAGFTEVVTMLRVEEFGLISDR